jgi:phage terminase small subunit
MPALPNPRHEAFAQHFVSGLRATKAYVAAGYKPKGAKQSASRLRRKPAVHARLMELITAMSEAIQILPLDDDR